MGLEACRVPKRASLGAQSLTPQFLVPLNFPQFLDFLSYLLSISSISRPLDFPDFPSISPISPRFPRFPLVFAITPPTPTTPSRGENPLPQPPHANPQSLTRLHFPMTINIRNLRLAVGLSQEATARKLGCSLGYMRRLEEASLREAEWYPGTRSLPTNSLSPREPLQS